MRAIVANLQGSIDLSFARLQQPALRYEGAIGIQLLHTAFNRIMIYKGHSGICKLLWRRVTAGAQHAPFFGGVICWGLRLWRRRRGVDPDAVPVELFELHAFLPPAAQTRSVSGDG